MSRAAMDAAASEELKPDTLNFLAWSTLWSSLTPDDLREAAWEALELPGSFADVSTSYWSTFHAGMPQPPIPALIHALLNIDGASVREDWMRAANYLDLTWSHALLPPDQLGPACEIFALAIEREESVIVETLAQRYLLPWLELAQQQLNAAQNPVLAELLEHFHKDLMLAINA
jgi:hypothetical protein